MRTMISVLLMLYGPLAAGTGAYSDYQTRRLLAPTPTERTAEMRGKIYIYDGLTSAQVEKALNSHFERMDNMMFVRTVQVRESGEEFIADDGCD